LKIEEVNGGGGDEDLDLWVLERIWKMEILFVVV